MVKIENFFFFAAFAQNCMITAFWIFRIAKKSISATLMAMFLVMFTLVLFRVNAKFLFVIKLNPLHLPIWFSVGPILYHFIRFSFLPKEATVSKVWLWSFFPSVIEVFTALMYWILLGLGREEAQLLKDLNFKLVSYSFAHLCLYTLASVFFVYQTNTSQQISVLYKKQLKYLQWFLFFMGLFIIENIFNSNKDTIFTSLIMFSFVNVFMFALFNENVSQSSLQVDILKKALNERQQAVVITNQNRIVEYVNTPFLEMVGYRHRDVVGRKPAFLQGELTTPDSVSFIRQKLHEQVAFTTDIVNYRKNGEAYTCRVDITPIFTDKELSHFVAYERDLGVISTIIDSGEQQLMKDLKQYFHTDKPYLDTQFQSADVADHLKINTRRVGELIKKYENQSFTDFVNGFRIQEAIELFKNKEHEQFTIETISNRSGFFSKSAFNTAFKREMGQTPSDYISILTTKEKVEVF